MPTFSSCDQPGMEPCSNCQRSILMTTGANGFDRAGSLLVASRGAVGLVKSGKKVVANNNYAFAA